MNEIKRENDILVSTLLNPEASISDLVFGGVTADNTQLLTPEQYKGLDFIKKQFSDKDGNFDEELFNRVYGVAANKFNDLATVQSYKDLEKQSVYNPNDIYRQFGNLTEAKGATISRVRNPFELTTGIRSLFGTQESEKSVRELAQKSKIFDTETGKYLDKSAEDLGLFGGLFSKPLVYATWDEDGTHFDASLGREVTHKKGDYKLNEDGKFYTETIGKKAGYGKQYVALSDILTKEDSWLNKVDFFDSDDKEKSVAGTLAKTVAKILPFLFVPGGIEVWGGITAVMSLAEIMPTFAKALEGIVVGDKETAFSKEMSLLENYWKRFDASYSDEAQGKMFGLEQLGATISDVFGQFHQMRFMAGLTKYMGINYAEAYSKGYNNFIKNYGDQYASLVKQGKIKPTKDGVLDFWKSIAASSPEMQAVMKQLSEMAKRLSLGYMTMVQSADVYGDAIQGGYDRRVAGLAALAAAAGQYGIMMNNELGTWFLNSATGYTAGENRLLMRKTVRPIYEQIARELEALAPTATNAEKQAVLARAFSKINSGTKSLWDAILNGSSEFWTRSTVEAVEEVTEEAVMDATKGIVDLLTWMGLGGDKNRQGSFNTIENTFSKEGLARYAQNALGGFIGGSIFQLQEVYIDPWLTGKSVDKNTNIDIIRAIQEGHAEELKERARDLGRADNNVLAGKIKFGDSEVEISSDGEQVTKGQVVAQLVINYIEYIQGLLGEYNLDLSGNELFEKVVRDQQILPLIKDSGISNLILDDFHTATEKLLKILSDIDTLTHKENPTGQEGQLLKDLQKQLSDLVNEINTFLSGESYEPYLKMALAYVNPAIRDRLTNISLYQFAKAKYGQDFSSYPTSGVGTTQESIRADYEEYKKTTDKKEQMHILMNAFDSLELKFSPAYKTYVDERYIDVRNKVIDSVLAKGVFALGDTIESDKQYFGLLTEISESLAEAGLPGLTLKDILRVDSDVVREKVIIPALNGIQEPLAVFAEQFGVSQEQLIDAYANVLSNILDSIPVQQWNTKALDSALRSAHVAFAQQILDDIKEKNSELSKADVDAMLVSMNITPEEGEIEESQLATYLARMTLPSFDVDLTENLAQNTISTYLEQESILDGEVVKFLKEAAVKSLTTKASLLKLEQQIRYAIGWTDEDLGYDVELSIDDEDRTNIVKLITQSIDEEWDLNTLVEAISNKLLSKYTNKDEYEDIASMFEKNPNFAQDLKNIISTFLTDNYAYSQYLKALSKEIQNNPLYDLLRSLEVELAPNVKQSIFDLLEIESKNLSSVSSITDYLKMPDVLEQIDSAKSVISIAKAILAGMEEAPVDFSEHLFGFNTQIREYLNKFKQGQNADKYQTITTEDIYTISQDLDILEQKLDFIKNLSNLNVQSKVEEDNKARNNFQNLLVSELKKQASKLTLRGVSILTPDDIALLEDEQTPMSLRLGKVEHSIYVKFKDLLDKNKPEELIDELLTNLNIDAKEIASRSLESYGIDSLVSQLSSYDFLVYLTTILGTDQNEYYYRYKAYLLSQDNDKVPLFTQEYATKIAYSFLKDKKGGVHDLVANWLNKNSGGYIADASRIFFLDGVSGSGKTTAVAKALLSFNDSKNILAAAPNLGQANKLRLSLGIELQQDKVLNKEQLLKLFLTDLAYNSIQKDSSSDRLPATSLLEQHTITLNNGDLGTYYRLKDANEESIYRQDVKDTPEILFIDEVTHFNTAELQVLNHAAEKYGFKIIALGDTLQESAKIINQENHIDSIFTWKSARLNLSIRPANINKKETIERFQTLIQSYYNSLQENNYKVQEAEAALKQSIELNGILLKYFEDDHSLDGDKIVQTITAADLNRLKAAANGEKIGIIANLTGTENTIDNIADQDLKAAILSSNLTPEDYVIYSPDKISDFAVQGSEADYFIINDTNLNGMTGLKDAVVRLYTFITRSQKGSLIRLSEDVVRTLHIENKLTAKPGIFKLPGLALLNTLKEGRIADIDAIIGNWIPSTEGPVTTVSTENVPETELEQLAVWEAETVTPEIPTPGDISQNLPPDKNRANGLDLFSYAFYNHTGLKLDSDGFLESDRVLPLDLSGVFPVNSIISEKSVLGFIKLKNLLTLYPNTGSQQFKSGLQESDFTEDIAEFVRAINPKLKNVNDRTALKWLEEHITVHPEQYIVGVLMNQDIDPPAFKFGLDPEREVKLGNPLLMGARRVTIQDDSFILDRLISTQALAKSETVMDLPAEAKSQLLPAILALEERAKTDLLERDMVIYKAPADFAVFDRADGRIVPRGPKEGQTFDSLQMMLNYGVNIKEVGLIVGTKNSEGKYRFIEWAKKHGNPNIELIALDKDGNFMLAGKYFARVSYTASEDSDITDYLLILDLKQIDFADAVKKIKNITGNLADKNKILHESSQTKIVLSLLKKFNAFEQNGEQTKSMFNQMLDTFKKNPDIHSRRIEALSEFLNNADPITEDSVKRLLIDSRMKSFGVLFVDHFLEVNNGNIRRIDTKTPVTFTEEDTGYQNLSPARGNRIDNGIYDLKDLDLSLIGLRNRHFEPRRYGISPDVLANQLERVDIDFSTRAVPKPQEQPIELPKAWQEAATTFNFQININPAAPSKVDIQGFEFDRRSLNLFPKGLVTISANNASLTANDRMIIGIDRNSVLLVLEDGTFSKDDKSKYLYGELTSRSPQRTFYAKGTPVQSIEIQDTVPESNWLTDNNSIIRLVGPDGKIYNPISIAERLLEEKLKNSPKVDQIIKEVTYALRSKLGTSELAVQNINGNLFLTYKNETHLITSVLSGIQLESSDLTQLIEYILNVEPNTLLLTEDGRIVNEAGIQLEALDGYFIHNNKWEKDIMKDADFVNRSDLSDSLLKWLNDNVSSTALVISVNTTNGNKVFALDSTVNKVYDLTQLEDQLRGSDTGLVENSFEDQEEILAEIEDKWEPTEEERAKVDFLTKYAKLNINGYKLISNDSEPFDLDSAYLEQMGDTFKQMWQDLNKQEIDCNNGK